MELKSDGINNTNLYTRTHNLNVHDEWKPNVRKITLCCSTRSSAICKAKDAVTKGHVVGITAFHASIFENLPNRVFFFRIFPIHHQLPPTGLVWGSPFLSIIIDYYSKLNPDRNRNAFKSLAPPLSQTTLVQYRIAAVLQFSTFHKVLFR